MKQFKTSEPIPELGNRTWEELEATRHDDGRLMFKDQLRYREVDGTVKTIDVRLAVPRPFHLGVARAECRKLFVERGLDEEKDKDLFAEFEQVCILAGAIRTYEPKHSQLMEATELYRACDEATLQDILGRLQAMRELVEVRDTVVDADTAWGLMARVAVRGHLLPLTDIAGHAQPSLVVFMARQLMRSPTGQSWLRSHATSTPELLELLSSTPSSEGQGTQTASASG